LKSKEGRLRWFSNTKKNGENEVEEQYHWTMELFDSNYDMIVRGKTQKVDDDDDKYRQFQLELASPAARVAFMIRW